MENENYNSSQANKENRDNTAGNKEQTHNRYGGDTNNFGNANQGGFNRDWWDKTRDQISSWFGDEKADYKRRMRQGMSGGHKGKGPKNYKRSEDRIREDVSDRLSDDDLLDASNIEVQVQGNDVILNGTVNTREEKRLAEDLTEDVSGVTHVENRIRVFRND